MRGQAAQAPPFAEPKTWLHAAVLDLETSPDPVIASRARDGAGPRAAIERTALHRLDAVAILRFDVGERAAVKGVSLQSLSSAATTEAGMLAATADAISQVAGSGGPLVTFNGVAHDLPFLRHRLLATGRPELVGDTRAPHHVDVMAEWADGGRYPRLADLCAALDLPVWNPRYAAAGVEGREAKCRLDVCTTFVLFLMLRAAAAGLATRFVEEGWRAMSLAVLAGGVSDPNLLGLLRHPSIVRVA